MLSGKSALVTGSTTGIGLGIATALYKAGATVMLHGLEEAITIGDLIKSIAGKKKENRPNYCEMDISDELGCQLLIQKSTEALGKIDILVNNAGSQFKAPIQDFPTEEWERLLHVNLSAPFYLSRSVIPQMYERRWGRIIQIGCAQSLVGSVNKCAYVATKHGIHGLTKVIALETAGSGVTANTICPGYVLTPVVQKQIDELSKAKNITSTFATMHFLRERQPSEKFVTPEQLGGLVLFLCSEDATQVTGAALAVDGGWTAR